MRHILPLLAIALLTACETTPITPMHGYEDTQSLTPEESRLWYSAAELDQQLEKSGSLYKDEDLRAYIEAVMHKLYPEYDDAIMVHIVDSPSLNAFALPNGSIYINTGMLSRLENEAQVATVLAHEGVHFTNKHSWKQRRNVKNSTAFSTGFGMVVGIPGIGDLISLSSIYGYSKDLEREADAEGFKRLQAAGYDVRQAPVTFEFLLAEVEALDIDEPYFFSTHPALEDRIANFKELVQSQGSVNGYKGTEAYRSHVDKLQQDGLPSLEILRNAPVELGGRTGFDVHLRYKTKAGLRMDMEMRGVVDNSGFYLLKYSAPTLHYFEHDRQTYETLTESLEL